VFEIIPVIGPILAAIPGVIVGLSQSLVVGTGVMVFYLVVQQFENHVLIPNVMRRAIGLHPLVTILAVLLGARLVGVAGAILAVPLATVVSIILADIFRHADDEELAG
jgi:predicted PurR-regulated permease PerM